MNQLFSNPVSIDTAIELLLAGEICAFPTETVYGLGADASSSDAVLKIYQAKKRPRFNPLIVHCADLQMAQNIAVFSPLALDLSVFWPGALTLVLPIAPKTDLSDLVTAGLDHVALRVPANAQAQSIIRGVGKPLAAPSANPSGSLSATIAAHVRLAFDDQVPVVDGGACISGIESTILAVREEKIVLLRSGALPTKDIEQTLGIKIERLRAGAPVVAPGMMKSHYAPAAAMRLNAGFPQADEVYLGFGRSEMDFEIARNLSPSGDLVEAGRNLFSCLAELDAMGATRIAVAPIPQSGLGEAINDRLQRAAAPRTSSD